MEAHSVLDFVRKNIPFERVMEVEENTPDFTDYINQLMETVYRGHKGSFKVESSKYRGMRFLWLILYLLTGEPKEWTYFPEEKLSDEIGKVLRKHFGKPSCFYKYAAEYARAKVGRETKTGWILVDPYVFKLLGGEIFFYCTLKALLKVVRRALEDPTYDYHLMTWEEGITEYLVSELKVVEEE